MVAQRCLRRAALLALALSLSGASSARASLGACAEQPLAQVFLPWTDPAWYEAAPDGGLEAGGGAWTLTRGARVAVGNEPFFVGGPGDSRSLWLPRGGSATTPPVCLGLGHPTLRLFVHSQGAPSARLSVSVLIGDPAGAPRELPIGVVGAQGAWAPTPPLLVGANALSVLPAGPAAFRFTADGGDWSLDDVYVDPYGKG